ncbi:hypothetical protein [Enemella sp. A6]|uniref:hypothetical protein n=1 Tax=Enemella sp. A6 TaxID=3440152 RepID=UPI003EB70663
MAVVCLASATGAPGVTTTSVGLAMFWPRDVVLVDVDRDAGQPILAGFLQGQDGGGRGMGAHAAAHREGRRLEPLTQVFHLIEDATVKRLFHPGFAHPAAAALFAPVWTDFTAALGELRGGFDIVLDAGRVGPGLPEPLLALADLLVLVVRSDLRSLAGLGGVIESVTERASLADTRVVLAVIGPQRPYSARDITAQFGHPVLVTLPWDPAAAEVLSDGATSTRRFMRSSLARSLQDAALTLLRATEVEQMP